LPRVPLESPLPLQPAAVATPCQHCIRPSPTSSLRTNCKFSGNVVQGIGHGVVIPAVVEEAIQAATGDMPSSLVDALRTVATIHPEWLAMALQAPSSARASTIATLLQEAVAHLSLAVEATTLREVAAAISNAP
jgi:hypothetical protein